MDIIYTNADGESQGVIKKASFDVAFGTDENEIELKTSLTNAKALGGTKTIEPGAFVFVPLTEFGGVVDKKALDTTSSPAEMTFTGRSWHGILEGHIIRPDSGSAHLTVSGECNTVIGQIISRLGLDEIFEASDTDTGVSISSYQFARYVGGYTGLRKMLKSVGMKLCFSKDVFGKCTVYACTGNNWSDQVDDNYVQFQLEHDYRPTNHLVCLGSGQLQNRLVVDLYTDENGNVSQTQTFTGLDEVAEVYDYNNAEDSADLIERGTEKLQDAQDSSSVKLDIQDNLGYTVGDMVTAKSVEVELSATVYVTEIMLTIDYNGTATISYEVGEEETANEYE